MPILDRRRDYKIWKWPMKSLDTKSDSHKYSIRFLDTTKEHRPDVGSFAFLPSVIYRAPNELKSKASRLHHFIAFCTFWGIVRKRTADKLLNDCIWQFAFYYAVFIPYFFAQKSDFSFTRYMIHVILLQ